MSISQRLWLMASLLVTLLITSSGISWYASNELSSKMHTIIELTSAQSVINNFLLMTRANREQVMLTLQHNPNTPDIAQLHDHAPAMHVDIMHTNRQEAGIALKELDQMTIVDTLVGKEMNTLLDARTAYLTKAFDPTVELLKKEQYIQANENLIKLMNPLSARVLNIGNHVLEVINNAIKAQEASAQQLEKNVTVFLTISAIISVLLALILSIVTINAVKRAILEVSQRIATAAGSMKFDVRIPERSDEFSILVIDANHLFTNFNQAITEANRVMEAIANADFTQRMEGQYVGDLAKLTQGVNGSANSVSFMMDELEKVMKQLHSGVFDVTMDQRVPKAFRNSVERALSSVSQVVNEINQVMVQMTDGDFNGRVSVNAEGDLLTMKNSVNASMSAIASAIGAISDVVAAQAEGDLTKALPKGSFKGQLHDLKNAINFASEKMKATVTQVLSASNIVHEAAEQVSQGSINLSGRVQEQAAAIEETSATMTEMAQAVQTNTANAQRVAELAHQVQHQTATGVDVMQKTISAMQSIKASSSKIADIVTLIDGIAFQTNLLALNAAVEAARAGDHGRGFAVVAGEVRALAQKSASAAKDIKELITDSVERIELGTQLADKSGEMLSGITGSIEQVANMIGEIASASNEQAIGISQVHKAMSDIDRVTQENAALVEETTTSAESLTTEANNLKESMSFFTTGDTVMRHHTHHHSAPLQLT